MVILALALAEILVGGARLAQPAGAKEGPWSHFGALYAVYLFTMAIALWPRRVWPELESESPCREMRQRGVQRVL
jgi:hypothetical protein